MIDSHAHLASADFDADRDEVVKRLTRAGVMGWIEIGTSLEDSRRAVDLADRYPNSFVTVGVHPNDVAGLAPRDWQELERLLDCVKVKAVGEVGFDFYRGGSLDDQRQVLEKFIGLATKRQLPLVFHVRNGSKIDAHDQLISLLKSYPANQRLRGVIHTYSGTVKQAEEYINLGMYLSFSGVITFKNAGEMVAAAVATPLERILIETDCPYLTPDPYRGKRNEPAYVALVARKVAEIKGIAVSEVDEITQTNTEKFFNCKF